MYQQDVTQLNLLYSCKQAHTSQVGLPPSNTTTSALWQKEGPAIVTYERIALRWIYGKHVETPLSPDEVETELDKIEADIKNYRIQSFGNDDETSVGPDNSFTEKYLTLAHWCELLPTDGTHIEVVQSMSNAVDQFTKVELDDAQQLREAKIASDNQSVELKKQNVAMETKVLAMLDKHDEGKNGIQVRIDIDTAGEPDSSVTQS
jgi:hypothetical protein